jgi:hypothetical protein
LTSARAEYCKENGVGARAQCDATLFFNFMLEYIEKMHPNKRTNLLWKQNWCTEYECKQCNATSPTDATSVQKENMYILYPVAPSLELAPDEEEVVVDDQNREYDYDMAACIEAQRRIVVDKFCRHCNTNTKHISFHDLQNLPMHFFVNYQQFRDKLVLVYHELTLRCNKSTDSAKYSLKGFVCHQGTEDAGHYSFYAVDSDGVWIHYNDDAVTKVANIEDILCVKRWNQTFPFMWYSQKERIVEESQDSYDGSYKRIKIGADRDEDVDMSEAFDWM